MLTERAQQQPKERKSMTTSTMGVAARTMWPDATNTLGFETEDGFTWRAALNGGAQVSRSVRSVRAVQTR
jgi:hypothetical protein